MILRTISFLLWYSYIYFLVTFNSIYETITIVYRNQDNGSTLSSLDRNWCPRVFPPLPVLPGTISSLYNIYTDIHIYILHLFFLQTYPNKIEKVVKTMSPLLIFMLLSGSLSPVRSIRESFCHLFFFVRGNGLRVLVYYMHYALRHKWTYQKKISSTQTSYCVYT